MTHRRKSPANADSDGSARVPTSPTSLLPATNNSFSRGTTTVFGTPVPILLRKEQLPAWYRNNDYILAEYRPVLGSVKSCLHSLLYLHNETLNIYTHLVPAGIALFGNYFLHTYFSKRFPLASAADQTVFHLYLTTTVVCFSISSAYHTFIAHSERAYSIWGRADYLTILLQILGSFISGIYVGFYCEPHLQKTYWAMIGTLSTVTGFVVVNPRLQHTRWRMLRLSSFIATGLSAFAPIVHAAKLFPYEQLVKQAGLNWYYLEGVCILVGCVFYATHLPEAKWPGRHDIWGASHSLFHVCVVLGAVCHLTGLLLAYEWNYLNPRCS